MSLDLDDAHVDGTALGDVMQKGLVRPTGLHPQLVFDLAGHRSGPNVIDAEGCRRGDDGIDGG